MTFGIAVTYFLFAAAPSWQFLIVAVVLQNMFYVYQPALQAMVADSTPPERRGVSFSIINLLHYISVPSPIIAGVLAAYFGLIPGMRIGYLVVAVAFIVAAFIRIKFKETLQNPEATPKLKEILQKIPESIVESTKTLKNASRSMRFLFASFAIYHFAWFMCSMNLIFYATEVVKVTELEWAALMAWFSVVNVLAALPCGKIVDRFGRKKPLMFAWLLFVPSLIGFVYGDVLVMSVCFMLTGVALITANSAYPALMADSVARENRGKIIGSTSFFFYILSSLGQLIGGFTYEYWNPAFPFLLAAVLFVPCFLLIWLRVQEPTNKEI
jgi:MFS family permease